MIRIPSDKRFEYLFCPSVDFASSTGIVIHQLPFHLFGHVLECSFVVLRAWVVFKHCFVVVDGAADISKMPIDLGQALGKERVARVQAITLVAESDCDIWVLAAEVLCQVS